MKYIRKNKKTEKETLYVSLYHLVDKCGERSVCGKAEVGVRGFELVERSAPPLRSMVCAICRKDNRIV